VNVQHCFTGYAQHRLVTRGNAVLVVLTISGKSSNTASIAVQ